MNTYKFKIKVLVDSNLLFVIYSTGFDYELNVVILPCSLPIDH